LALSIGDGELAETADAVVSLPEIFSYWLQAGRIDVGFLGAAQIDRFGNLNTTVIGGYRKPKTRLPGAGGAPEIAHHAKQIFVVLKQSPRSFVAKLDFCTSAGFINGHCERARRAIPGAGPQAVITDLGVLKPATGSQELTLVARYEDVSVERIRAATGWPLAVADTMDVAAAPASHSRRWFRRSRMLQTSFSTFLLIFRMKGKSHSAKKSMRYRRWESQCLVFFASRVPRRWKAP